MDKTGGRVENKRELLDRCARDGEERVLLARVLDKLELSQNRGIRPTRPFSPRGSRRRCRIC